MAVNSRLPTFVWPRLMSGPEMGSIGLTDHVSVVWTWAASDGEDIHPSQLELQLIAIPIEGLLHTAPESRAFVLQAYKAF
jgi:hypothetical protein